MFLSEQFNTTHFGNLHTNYFCSLVLHSLPCEQRKTTLFDLLQRSWWNCMYLQLGRRTLPKVQKDLGCSQPSLSEYFPTWFSQFLWCIAPLCCDLMSEILKKRKGGKNPFPYWHSGELKTRNEKATVAADMDCLFNSSNLFTLMKHQKIWVSGN